MLIGMNKRSKRTIKVSNESIKKLAKMFNCTERMVYKALGFESRTLLAKQIQYAARTEMGGWVEASLPEEDMYYDIIVNGERILRKFFNNGAVLDLNLAKDDAVIKYKGNLTALFHEASLDQISQFEDIAKSL